MILGIVLLVAGVGLFVSSHVNKSGSMKTVSDIAGGSLPMKWDEDVKAMSIGNYYKEVVNVFGDLSNAEVAKLEKLLGMQIISKTLSDTTGVEQEHLKASKVQDIGKTIADKLTLKKATDKMEIKLADMPLFKNEEFLNAPLNAAFKDITAYNLDQFIKVVYDEEATPENPASKKLLQKIGKTPIKDLNKNITQVVDESYIKELVDIKEDSPKILKHIGNTMIKDLSTTIKTMKLKEMIDITEESHNVMKKFQDLTVDELSDPVITSDIIDNMLVSELVEVKPDSSLMLKSLKDTAVKDLPTKIENLTLEEVFEEPNEGPLSLIEPTTKITDIPAAMSESMPHSSLYVMDRAGIFPITEPKTIGGKLRSYNQTMAEAVASYSDAISGGSGVLAPVKRPLLYLYDDDPAYQTEKSTGAIGGSGTNANAKHIAYAMDPANAATYPTVASLYEFKALDISTALAKNADGYYELTQAFLDTAWGGSPLPSGAEIVLQQSANLELKGDPAAENTYTHCFSVTSIYEVDGFFESEDDGTSGTTWQFHPASFHASIRIGADVKMIDRIGGYSYISAFSGSLSIWDSASSAWTTATATSALPIERRMVNPSATAANPTPAIEPNIRYDVILK